MTATHIAVIDYGMGNLHSVGSALHHVAPEATVSITADPAVIASADRILFPGVGAIRDCMAEIKRLKLDQAVKTFIASGKPTLAICVGLQALMDFSDECGGVECLSYFPGSVKSFSDDPGFRAYCEEHDEHLKVPHMGWNEVVQVDEHPLWIGIPNNSRFYFVHSFFVKSEDPALVAGRCDYGNSFDAVLRRDNVFATQFHPEKSHTHGLQLLKNFTEWNGQS